MSSVNVSERDLRNKTPQRLFKRPSPAHLPYVVGEALTECVFLYSGLADSTGRPICIA